MDQLFTEWEPLTHTFYGGYYLHSSLYQALRTAKETPNKSDAPGNYPCECPLPIVLLCTHAGGGYLSTLVVRHASAHTFALRASYSHILLPPLWCYHSSQPPLPPINYSRSFLKPSCEKSLPQPHQRLASRFWEWIASSSNRLRMIWLY
jgi:hypothetical protein